jgi:hypothetical protein
VKSAEEIMNILEAYDLTGSYRDAGELAGCSHHTVARYVRAREEGRLVPGAASPRAGVIEGFLPKLEELVERSKGKVRADVAHEKITAMGFTGSGRTTRRAVARLKGSWHSGRRRVHRPWVAEPGMWAQYDFGDGPLIGGTATVLFCLWLAWQSVNRFAGADLSVLTRFSEWFGEAETIWLSRTFRSPQSLCDVAGEFVMRNREQLKKRVRSSAPEPREPLAAIALKDRSQYDNAVLKHCMQLDAQLDSPATLLVLSRYSRGRDDVPSVLEAKFSRLTVDFNTVHASKGKEADYVIVLGLESRGFPSAIEDDPLLQLAMAAPDSFPYAEERRLFYVALTRARRSVLLLTRAGHESPFLIELIQAKALRVHSSAGADITPVICPKCKKRIMRQRQGKRGPFLGCGGYPLCRGTIDVTSGYVPQGLRPSSAPTRTR